MDIDEELDTLASRQLTLLLGTAFQVVLAEFVRRLDAAGYEDLRPVHGMAFQALYGTGVTSTELADRLGVTKQAAGQMVADLERRGYVRREDHPDGGRRRLVVLTDEARRHLSVAGGVLTEMESELAEQVGDPGLVRLRTELSRVVRAVVGEEVPPLRPLW
jgi:DNA-binding MarR family transcriptional regulator